MITYGNKNELRYDAYKEEIRNRKIIKNRIEYSTKNEIKDSLRIIHEQNPASRFVRGREQDPVTIQDYHETYLFRFQYYICGNLQQDNRILHRN